MSVQCQGVITRFYIQLFFIIISWNVFEYYRNQLFFQRVKRLLTIKYLTSEKMKKKIDKLGNIDKYILTYFYRYRHYFKMQHIHFSYLLSVGIKCYSFINYHCYYIGTSIFIESDTIYRKCQAIVSFGILPRC